MVTEDDEVADAAKEALQDLACLTEVVVLAAGEINKLEQRAILGMDEEDNESVYEALESFSAHAKITTKLSKY